MSVAYTVEQYSAKNQSGKKTQTILLVVFTDLLSLTLESQVVSPDLGTLFDLLAEFQNIWCHNLTKREELYHFIYLDTTYISKE